MNKHAINIMLDEIDSFARALGLDIGDITHVSPIGTRGDAQVFAVGYWGQSGTYTHGTIERRWDASSFPGRDVCGANSASPMTRTSRESIPNHDPHYRPACPAG